MSGSGQRALSFICYLTKTGRRWTSSDGGTLCLDTGERVLPESGSLVLFDSKRVWHSVEPTRR